MEKHGLECMTKPHHSTCMTSCFQRMPLYVLGTWYGVHFFEKGNRGIFRSASCSLAACKFREERVDRMFSVCLIISKVVLFRSVNTLVLQLKIISIPLHCELSPDGLMN